MSKLPPEGGVALLCFGSYLVKTSLQDESELENTDGHLSFRAAKSKSSVFNGGITLESRGSVTGFC